MMEILFSDRDLAVCIKPVGLDSEHQLPEELKKILGGEIFPIHRLDQNVGGVMLFARSKAAAAQLSKLVQDGALVKEYVAQVHGTPPETGDWTDFLFKDSTKNKVFVVKKERKGVKKARLEYVTLAPSVVRIRLHDKRPYEPKNEEIFRRTIRVAFEQRRKTLPNALQAGYQTLTKEQCIAAVEQTGLRADVRGERLTMEQFVALADILTEMGV